MKKVKCKQHAFTLLEMSIVLFIISLLILIVLPNLTHQRQHAKRVHQDAMVTVIQTQVDEYANEHGTSRVSLTELKNTHYLTTAQFNKAKEQHLTIVNGKVTKQ